MTKSEAAAEGLELMIRLNLMEKKNAMADNLSGGQKRKLSLAIALIGGSEVRIIKPLFLLAKLIIFFTLY